MRLKLVIKRHFPQAYIRLLRLRQWLDAVPDIVSAARLRYALRNGRPNVVVHLNLRAGLFANLSSYVCLLKYFDLMGSHVFIRLTGSTYRGSEGGDWFGRYFDRIQPMDSAYPQKEQRIFSFCGVEALRLDAIGTTLTLAEAKRVLSMNAVVKNDINLAVDNIFSSQGISGSRLLGVHYRGTDKVLEAQRVPYERVLSAARQILELDGPFDAVLVASDEAKFVEYMMQQKLGLVVISPPYTAAGNACTAPHLTPGLDKAVLGREALVTCLALARCSTLLRTSSYLSAWAKVFNSSLTTYTLNAAYNPTTFPEVEVMRLDRGRSLNLGASHEDHPAAGLLSMP